MLTGDLLAAVKASSLAVLAWQEGAATRCRGVVALVSGERPVLAFPYADAEAARTVAASPEVLLAAIDPRGTGPAFRPVLVRARPTLLEDPTGEVFEADLLDQELRRFPPSRLLADSPLLRREHWWYLPRLLVRLEVTGVEEARPRRSAEDHLLVVRTSTGLEAAGATLAEPATEALTPEVGDPAPSEGPAVLFGQDASFPDLERWSQWRYRGRWDGTTFRVDEAPARTGLATAPGLLQRWRRQRALERGCRQSIEAHTGPARDRRDEA